MQVVPVRSTPLRSRSAALVALTLACAAAFAVTYGWTVRTASGQELDIEIFARAQTGSAAWLRTAGLLRGGLPLVLGTAAAVLAVVAARGRAWSDLVRAVVVVAGATGLAHALKSVLARPYLGEHGYTTNTFPSGHVAATAALGVALVILWPSARRAPAVLLAVATSTLACVVAVVGHAHRPSDALGALLLVGAVTALAAAAAVGTRPGPAP